MWSRSLDIGLVNGEKMIKSGRFAVLYPRLSTSIWISIHPNQLFAARSTKPVRCNKLSANDRSIGANAQLTKAHRCGVQNNLLYFFLGHHCGCKAFPRSRLLFAFCRYFRWCLRLFRNFCLMFRPRAGIDQPSEEQSQKDAEKPYLARTLRPAMWARPSSCADILSAFLTRFDCQFSNLLRDPFHGSIAAIVRPCTCGNSRIRSLGTVCFGRFFVVNGHRFGHAQH